MINGFTNDMTVDGEAGKVNRLLVGFDITAIPTGATVTSATLSLCYATNPSGGSQGRTHELRRVTSSWGELLTDWITQPTVAGSATAALTVPNTKQCMTLSVTADVQAWVDLSATNYGWRLADGDETSGGTADARYETHDNGTSTDHPKLSIDYYP
jgi:hypothetical protein